jgi:transposase
LSAKRVLSVVSAIVEAAMSWEPWRVSDAFWAEAQPLLPVVVRRRRYPGRKRRDDRACLEGILFVLCSGLPWDAVPAELGVSGVTCWRRFDEWRRAEVWPRLLALLVGRLEVAGALDEARLLVDASIAPAKKGARRQAAVRSIAAVSRPSGI